MSNNAHRPRSSRGGFRLYGGDARGVYGSPSRGTMIYGKRPRPRWPFVALAIAIAAAVAAFFIVRAVAAGNEQAAEEQAASQEPAEETVSGPSGTVKISAVGDLTLGTDTSFDADTSFPTVYNSNSPDYFLKQVSTFLAGDQLTIGNFEGTLTTSTEREDKTYAFKGDAAYTQVLTDGSVEAVNLANNHSYDYGQQSYTDTIAALDAAGVKNFGYERTAVYEVDGIKVGMLGINAVDREAADVEGQMVEDIASLDQEGCHIIVASIHWGIEGDHEVDSEQTTLAHTAVDAGCDLVLGTHPHVLQGIEKYKDRYICYSLGNFCFGGNTNPQDFNTMIFQQTFTVENGELVVNGTTLQQMDVVPCSVSSTTLINNYQPMPLSGEQGAQVLAKLNGYTQLVPGEEALVAEEVGEDGTAAVTAESAKSTGSASQASVEAVRQNAGVSAADGSGAGLASGSSDAGSDTASTGAGSSDGVSDTFSSNASEGDASGGAGE